MTAGNKKFTTPVPARKRGGFARPAARRTSQANAWRLRASPAKNLIRYEISRQHEERSTPVQPMTLPDPNVGRSD